MTNPALEVLYTRRSVRKYLPRQVEEEKLEAILKAGMYAPSGHNKQPGLMVVVQDQETIRQLSRMNAEILGRTGIDPFFGAPTVVVVLADSSTPNAVMDGSLVMGNLMNAARAVGVDSCWINRARQEFESEEGKALLKKWGVEGDYIGIGHCILGYGDGEHPEPKPRKEGFVIRV